MWSALSEFSINAGECLSLAFAHNLLIQQMKYLKPAAHCIFLLEADGIDFPLEGRVECYCNDDSFEDCNEDYTPSAAHELCRQYGALNSIDFLSVGHNNIFAHENFAAGKDFDNDDSTVVKE